MPAREIHDRLRAYTPWPGLTAELRGEPVKIVAAEVMEEIGEGTSGTILGPRGGLLAVACGGGTVLGVSELQRPGKRALRAADFANGERLRAGESFT
jgi:methionyl-tRNA formyltransferase